MLGEIERRLHDHMISVVDLIQAEGGGCIRSMRIEQFRSENSLGDPSDS